MKASAVLLVVLSLAACAQKSDAPITKLLHCCISQQALNTGVTTSWVVDAHGKTLSYALLEMEI